MATTDDPFGRQDSTSIRPRPGAGKRGWAEAARPRVPAPSMVRAEPISAAAQEWLGIGLNPLVQAASPLLLIAGQLRGTVSPLDVAALRRQALDEVRRFEERARAAGEPHETVLAARYALCAALDEAVLSTPWGSQSEWAQHPLLVALHREAWGGEKFFEMLDRISRDPGRHIDLMELQYLCLAFGFTGKYQLIDHGHDQLAEVQQDLYRKIRTHRGPAEDELSLRWRGLEDRRNPIIRYVPWWLVGAAALAIIAITYTVYHASLTSLAAPIHAELARVGVEDFVTPVEAPPTKGPTLKQLLAPDEAVGTVTVIEDRGKTTVRLIASSLFASGSAKVNPASYPTLQRVASALNQVPGRVWIFGHTDSQPIRSVSYADNFELSRARAVSVENILRQTIDNPGRLTSQGKGDREPLDPVDQSRNRRVEIVHVRGT